MMTVAFKGSRSEGCANPALQAKLTAAFETQKLENTAAPPTLPKLDIDLGTLYQQQLRDLAKTVNGPEASQCRERVPDLINQIVIHPPSDGDDEEPQIELTGDLKAMLTLGGVLAGRRITSKPTKP